MTLPGERGVGELPFAAKFHRIDGSAFGPADEREACASDRRRHEPPVPDARWVPGAPAPDFLARLLVVPADAIAARDQQFRPAGMRIRHRRAVGFERFLAGF